MFLLLMVLSFEKTIYFNIYILHGLTMIQGCVLLCYYHIESTLLANQVLNHIHSINIQPFCGEKLIVTKEDDCSKINQGLWSSITIFSGLCNSLNIDLIIANNTCLELINIQNKALQNINSLVISDNPYLIFIMVGSYSLGNAYDVTISSRLEYLYIIIDLPYSSAFIPIEDSFEYTMSLTLSSIFLLMYI